MQIPFISSQQRTMEMQGEALSKIGAQNMDSNVYLVSELEDIEFQWEDPDLNMDAYFWPGMDTLLSPSTSNYFEMNDWKPDSDWRREISLLFIQQLQTLRTTVPLGWRTVASSGQELIVLPIIFTENCLKDLILKLCVCVFWQNNILIGSF